MVAALGRDEPGPPGHRARQLQRAVDRLGAARQRGRPCSRPPGARRGQAAARAPPASGWGDTCMKCGTPAPSTSGIAAADLRMVVAERRRAVAGEEVEVGAPLCVPQREPLAAHEVAAPPDEVQRLDQVGLMCAACAWRTSAAGVDSSRRMSSAMLMSARPPPAAARVRALPAPPATGAAPRPRRPPRPEAAPAGDPSTDRESSAAPARKPG